MKISQEPVSAFSVYSETLKQKKKLKKSGDLSKLKDDSKVIKKKSLNTKNETKRIQQMNEIGSLLKVLAEQSGVANPNLFEIKNLSKRSRQRATRQERKLIKEAKAKNEKMVAIGSNGQKSEGTLSVTLSNRPNSDIEKVRKITTKQKTVDVTNNFNNIDTIASANDVHKERNSLFNSNNKVKCQPGRSKGKISDNHLQSSKCMLLISPESSQSNDLHTKISNDEAVHIKKVQLKRKKDSKSVIVNQNGKNVGDISKKKTTTGAFEVMDTELPENVIENNQSDKLNCIGKKERKNESHDGRKNKILKKESIPKKMKGYSENSTSSINSSKNLFDWLISPIKQLDFMREYWEQQPLLVKRERSRDYYSELLSTPGIDAILRENNIYFTKHLDVTSYTNGVRETHNLSGRAQANVVWDFYSNGCSVRMLNPQAFVPKIHELNALLQEYFGCFVGANVYLTPPNSQGFAPHYDDIEAFVLQIEGKKQWKVYKPRNDTEVLPRESSPNLTEEELSEPCLEAVLEPGDMLYFPRGYIHQASTVDGEHSLHITLSAYQKTAWVDLLEKTLPVALKKAAREDVEFRKGLPRDYLGLEYHGSPAEKTRFATTATDLVSRLGRYISESLGQGVDLMGARFMHDALPPVFTSVEKTNSGLGGGLKMTMNGELVNRVQVDLDSRVKLIRANICRMVQEEEEVRLYHCLDNPLEYHAEEPQFLVLPQDGVQVITSLFLNYPEFTRVRSLPHVDPEQLLTLVSDLWEAGLLLAEGLQQVDSDDEETEEDD